MADDKSTASPLGSHAKRGPEHPIARTALDRSREASGTQATYVDGLARQCVGLVQTLAMHSIDPSKSDAFEAVKVAVFALLGKRGSDLPPLDCLTRLHSILHGGSVKGKRDRDDLPESDIRTLRELVLNELVKAQIDPRDQGEGMGHYFALPDDLRPDLRRPVDFRQIGTHTLCSEIRRRLGSEYAALSPQKCEAVLRGLQKSHAGRRSVNGVVADIILAARAYGCSDRASVLRAVYRAVKGRNKSLRNQRPKRKKR
jgi:hypothetical protein